MSKTRTSLRSILLKGEKSTLLTVTVVLRSFERREVTRETSQFWTMGSWIRTHPDTNNSIRINNVLRSIFQIFLRGCFFQGEFFGFCVWCYPACANSVPKSDFYRLDRLV